MNILFWNTHRSRKIDHYLINIICEYHVDIAILAEYYAAEDILYGCGIPLNNKIYTKYFTSGCKRIIMLGNIKEVQPAAQNHYYSIQIIYDNLILCGLHLPSDIHGSRSEERDAIIRGMMHDIHTEERKIGQTRTLIAGDFNEMPYEKGCMNADHVHGLPVFEMKKKSYRTVVGEKYQKYYNPMWNFFGDFEYPPGTYYYDSATMGAAMWYMFDQFIVGYDLYPKFKMEKLSIITGCKKDSLMDSDCHPNSEISDHFPIICTIDD